MVGGFLALLVSAFGLLHASQAHAQAANDFSLEVTPSPLVTTVKPGTTTQLELKIHNNAPQAENLKIEPRSFTINPNSEEVELNDTTPPDISNWISFSKPRFTVQAGEWFTEQVRLNVPREAGFSYSFALVVSRQANPQPTSGGRLLKGSLAVFTLVNVDRPGATRKIDIGQFISTKRVYEYLPAELNVRLQNTGNTIVQPYGNIYIQRSETSQTPITTIPVNASRGYILPGATRTLETTWDSGFPAYKITNDNGTQHKKLVWDWTKISQFRMGRYTAKLIAVYNDGQRDVPIQASVTFWVIPWKILLIFLVLLILVGFGVWSFARKVLHLAKRGKAKAEKHKSTPKA